MTKVQGGQCICHEHHRTAIGIDLKNLPEYDFVTEGEKLVYYLGTRVLPEIPWNNISYALSKTGRNIQLCEFFNEIALVNFACRLVTIGTSLLTDASSLQKRVVLDDVYQIELREYILDKFPVSRKNIYSLTRVLSSAVVAAGENVSNSQRRKLKSIAFRTHRHCYMCGVTLDFDEVDIRRKFTLDHIWPKCYGGNSIDDNLLPACGHCNSSRKKDLASWAMGNIQSLILGLHPSENETNSVEGHHKFAMHYYAAKLVAVRKRYSLKRAFLRLGPWTDIEPIDRNDTGDFFNLTNHINTGLL